MPTATEVEKMAEDVFKAMNMATHRARNSTVKRGNIFVTQSNDIFGVFDLIAIEPVSGHVYLYQITRSRAAATARRRKIEKWIEEHGPPGNCLEEHQRRYPYLRYPEKQS